MADLAFDRDQLCTFPGTWDPLFLSFLFRPGILVFFLSFLDLGFSLFFLFFQIWDPLSSLSASELLAPRDLPAPLPGFIDVAMILLGIQVEHKCIEKMRMGRPYHTKIFFKCKTFDLGK